MLPIKKSPRNLNPSNIIQSENPEQTSPPLSEAVTRRIRSLERELSSIHLQCEDELQKCDYKHYCFPSLPYQKKMKKVYGDIQNLRKTEKDLIERGSHIFHNEGVNPRFKVPVYRLKEEVLAENKSHMFFSLDNGAYFLTASELEYSNYHPSNKRLNSRFHLRSIEQIGQITVWCSFPIESQTKCEEIARKYGLTRQLGNKTLIVEEGGVKKALKFPAKDNLLFFEGGSYWQDSSRVRSKHLEIQQYYAR